MHAFNFGTTVRPMSGSRETSSYKWIQVGCYCWMSIYPVAVEIYMFVDKDQYTKKSVLERDQGSVFDARVNSGEHGHSIDVHNVEVKGKWAYFSA